jgi:hypothetical protein
MDAELLQETLDNLMAVVGMLVEDHHHPGIVAPGPSGLDQLRWVHTLRQFAQDTDVLTQSCAILLRRMRAAEAAGL